MEPQIIIPSFEGRHNENFDSTVKRLDRSGAYQDLSTVILCPSRGKIPVKVIANWQGILKPMNQKCIGPIFALGMEVGEAYNQLVKAVLDHPELSTYKYLFTVEEDNLVPPDVLLKLYESIEGKIDSVVYDVVQGIYYTKGEGGMPQIYGDPNVLPRNFAPQIPRPETVQRCNGLGMGCTLFRMDVFRKMPPPWFKTMQQFVPGEGLKCCTQDLYFYNRGFEFGFKYACDTRVRSGHYDFDGVYGPADTVW